MNITMLGAILRVLVSVNFAIFVTAGNLDAAVLGFEIIS